MRVGERIRAKRKELKISADELALRIGKDRSTIFRYEKGDIEKLPLDILEPIAKALGTTPQYLMGWEEVKKKNNVQADIVLRMRDDEVFLEAVETLHRMDAERLIGFLRLIK